MSADVRLRVLSCNVNGIAHRVDIIAARLHSDSVDIMLIQETRTTANILDSRMAITGYTYFRRDRGKGAAGGVGVYVKNNLGPTPLKFKGDLEVVAVVCRLGSTPILVASAYKPPTHNSDVFFDGLSSLLNSNAKYANAIIGCDDNCDIRKAHTSAHVAQFCAANNLLQIVPDTFTTHKLSNIDHVYVKGSTSTVCSLTTNIEHHHCCVRGDVGFQVNNYSVPDVRQQLTLWAKARWDDMCLYVHSERLCERVAECSTAEAAWFIFHSVCTKSIDLYVPQVVCRPRRWSPWMTSNIRERIHARDKLYRLHKAKPHRIDLKHDHKNADRLVKKLIKQAKCQHFKVLFDGRTRTQRQIWTTIKTITRPSDRKSPSVQLSNGTLCSGDEEKCKVLMEQFASVWRQDEITGDPIEADPGDNPTCPPALMCYLMGRIRPGKAEGGDNLPGIFLKTLRYQLAEPLSYICTLAIASSVPTAWKSGIIIPIPKTKTSNLPTNFRPITLLSICSKLMERWILSLICDNIDSRLPKSQFGFRSKMGTSEALLTVDKYIHEDFELCRKLKTPTASALISFDTAKAFDRVSHPLLIQTLRHHFQLPPWALRFVQDFLTNRTVQVRIGRVYSDARRVLSGVPQGGVLSPILFNASAVAFSQIILSQNTRLVMFADDILIVKPLVSDMCADDLQADVNAVNQCIMMQNQILNSSKTHGMVCTVSRTSTVSEPEVNLNGEKIVFGDELRYLGVVIDRRLSMRSHIDAKVMCAKRLMGAVCAALQGCGQMKMIGRIWSGAILPILSYAAFMTIGKTQAGDRKMARIQLAAARYATNIYNNDEHILQILHWQPICCIAKTQRLRMAYRIYHGLTTLHDDEILCKQSSSGLAPRYETRQRKQTHDKMLRTSFASNSATGDKCVCRVIAGEWNGLAADKVQMSMAQFKIYTKMV